MRNYLILVEGAHDIAVIEKLLKVNGIKDKVNNKSELQEVWYHTIPTTFPFQDGRLDRITPIPSFVKNDEISVAIKNANSDVEIPVVLQQFLKTMSFSEIEQINGIMLLCDADRKKAAYKIRELLNKFEGNEDFKLIINENEVIIDTRIKPIPVYTFVFPDNENEGNLENLLLETAKISYPELLSLAEVYIQNAAQIQKELKKEQHAKKAIVGCIVNVMKPGKANQVSIADNKWICSETLAACESLHKLNDVINEMLMK